MSSSEGWTIVQNLRSPETFLLIFYYFTGKNSEWRKYLSNSPQFITKDSPFWKWMISREIRYQLPMVYQPYRISLPKQYSNVSMIKGRGYRRVLVDLGPKTVSWIKDDTISYYIDGISYTKISPILELVLSRGIWEVFEFLFGKCDLSRNGNKILEGLYSNRKEFWKTFPKVPLNPSKYNYPLLLDLLVKRLGREEALKVILRFGWNPSMVPPALEVFSVLEDRAFRVKIFSKILMVGFQEDLAEKLFSYVPLEEKEEILIEVLDYAGSLYGGHKKFRKILEIYGEVLPPRSLGQKSSYDDKYMGEAIDELFKLKAINLLDYRKQLWGRTLIYDIGEFFDKLVQSETEGNYKEWIQINLDFFEEIVRDQRYENFENIMDIFWPYLEEKEIVEIFGGNITLEAKDYLIEMNFVGG